MMSKYATFSLSLNLTINFNVGDRPEDQACALAANIPFMWAADWRGECD